MYCLGGVILLIIISIIIYRKYSKIHGIIRSFVVPTTFDKSSGSASEQALLGPAENFQSTLAPYRVKISVAQEKSKLAIAVIDNAILQIEYWKKKMVKDATSAYYCKLSKYAIPGTTTWDTCPCQLSEKQKGIDDQIDLLMVNLTSAKTNQTNAKTLLENLNKEATKLSTYYLAAANNVENYSNTIETYKDNAISNAISAASRATQADVLHVDVAIHGKACDIQRQGQSNFRVATIPYNPPITYNPYKPPIKNYKIPF